MQNSPMIFVFKRDFFIAQPEVRPVFSLGPQDRLRLCSSQGVLAGREKRRTDLYAIRPGSALLSRAVPNSFAESR